MDVIYSFRPGLSSFFYSEIVQQSDYTDQHKEPKNKRHENDKRKQRESDVKLAALSSALTGLGKMRLAKCADKRLVQE